jgi:hypothetical protein
MVRAGSGPVVVPGGDPVLAAPGSAAAPTASGGTSEIAVDLVGRASDAQLELGRRAVAGLPAALLRLGAARLAAGESDDPERLVPGYASPPRGALATAPEGGVAWSRDPR